MKKKRLNNFNYAEKFVYIFCKLLFWGRIWIPSLSPNFYICDTWFGHACSNIFHFNEVMY